MRNRSSDCQTLVYCSVAAEGCEGEGGRGQEKPGGEKSEGAQNRKGSPHTCAEKKCDNGELEITKRGLAVKK